MSPVHGKHKPQTKHVKSRVPIVNVFDEDDTQSQQNMQPAHRPVVVEIEDVNTSAQEPPVTPPPAPVFGDNIQVPQQEVAPTPMPAAPVMPQIPEQQPMATQMPAATTVEVPPVPQAGEQPLPSFFEQDLKSAPMQGAAVQPQMPQQAAMPAAAAAAFETAVPQAVVGEIHEAAAGGSGNTKKIIGIALVVVALVILAVGGLFLYARNLFAPVEMPKATPTPAATVRPIATPTATPVATDSGKVASISAEMKKKIKVDVLNGTKIAGLASKEAAVIKKEGYVTGTVGNGKPEDAGTIKYASASADMAKDIQRILTGFTFKLTIDPKAAAIVVTLGEPKE